MSASLSPRSRISAIVVAVVALLSACGSPSGGEGLYADISPRTALLPAPQVEGLETTTETGVVAVVTLPDNPDAQIGIELVSAEPQEPSLPNEVLTDIEAFYDNFLAVRAAVIERSTPLDELDGIASARAKTQVGEALAYNESLHLDERPSAVHELWLFSNIESITQADSDTLVLRDCTERHEVNALDQFWVSWETNEVEIDISTRDLIVTSFTTVHNGFLEPDAPIGCAPLSFRERAEAASAQVWTELAAWGRSVDDRNEAALSASIGEPLRSRLVEEAVSNPNRIDPAVESASFAAAGLDTLATLGAQGAEGVTVLVNSCHRFPDGRTGTNTVTGVSINDVDVGAEQALQFRVVLDSARANRVDQVVAIEYIGDRCDR